MTCEEFVALGAGFPDKVVGFPESTNEFRALQFCPSFTLLYYSHASLRALAIE
jgi:hypothetical protein